jgi:hypothetical protein
VVTQAIWNQVLSVLSSKNKLKMNPKPFVDSFKAKNANKYNCCPPWKIKTRLMLKNYPLTFILKLIDYCSRQWRIEPKTEERIGLLNLFILFYFCTSVHISSIRSSKPYWPTIKICWKSYVPGVMKQPTAPIN